MARSITMQGSFGGEPLRNLEREEARAASKRPTNRELSEMGNRPLSDSGRRTPDEWPVSTAPALRKTLEAFLVEESQPKKRGAAWKALESLFENAP